MNGICRPLAGVVFAALVTPLVSMAADAPKKPKAIAAQALKPVAASLTVVGGTWVAQGPRPIQNAQVEGIANFPVAGGVHAIVAHPTSADTLWVGTTNGGIWKTTNATNASPTWTPLTDSFGSFSIGALDLDATDGTFQTLVAGAGNFSSFGVSGPVGTLFRTTNGGTSWTSLSPTALTGKSMTGVVARGATIVVSVNSTSCAATGIFRSTDTGATFSIVSGAGGSGLPAGGAYDVAPDPTNSAVLYTSIWGCTTGTQGIYKSTDTGATWTKVSSVAIDALLATTSGANGRLTVGASGQIYAGIVTNGKLAGLFRSSTGATWTQLDTPVTNESGMLIGVNPEVESGGQGYLHFSIVADPTNANIVYVGGDRQGFGNSAPNSIGASNYSGRLFRVNAAASTGTQATSLTHCATASAACNNTVSTSNNSSPHADSRSMAFDAAGNLLESDDGGIYRRTNPRTTGDWFSVIGSLQVTEMHDVAYDGVSNVILSGNQDTGSCEQIAAGGTTWNEMNQGDGGDVAVDDITSLSQSTRYSSSQVLGGFYRRVVNSAGTVISSVFPSLTVVGGGEAFQGQFVTPVEVNCITASRILFGGNNHLYESLDRGDTITQLAFDEPVQAMVYGGRASGVSNVDLIYAISYYGVNSFGPNVYVRTSGSGAPVQTATSPGSSYLMDVAVDTTDWHKAYVVNSTGQVWSTSNTGASWTNVTGNLGSGTTDLRTVVFVPGSPSLIVVGGLNGVFRMATDNPGVWNQLGSGMSHTHVWDLDYDALDDTLVAGTLGRGAWKLNPVVNVTLPSLSINDAIVTEGNSGTTNAVFTVSMTPAVGFTAAVNYATANGTATGGNGTTFSNAGAISIPVVGNATPYPSTISVSGVTGTVSKVTVTLSGFTHTYSSDVDVLLVGPGGQSVLLMSDAGGANSSSGLNLTFDDAGLALTTGALTSGTYRPTDISDGLGTDSFSSPAPAGPWGSALSVFNATSVNGTWTLYVVDDVDGDSGSFSGGWSLTITAGGDYVATSGTLTFDPGVTSRTISVPVNGDTTVESNETFVVNLSTPINATIADGQGQGTIVNDDGIIAPPANVIATATSGTNVNLTWNAVAGASSYRVYRRNGASFAFLIEVTVTSMGDSTVVPNTAYLYKVRSYNGNESADSNLDLATTATYTDPTLAAGSTRVKAVHFTELLTEVNAVRTLAELTAASFTAPAPAAGQPILRAHLLDLRNGLNAARSTLGLTAVSYADPTITAGSTQIQAVHINDLRNGVK